MDGGRGDDRLTGSDEADPVAGGGGRDVLLGGGGGDDTLADDDGTPYPDVTSHFDEQRRPVDADVLDGGPGEDAVDLHGQTVPLIIDLRIADGQQVHGVADTIARMEAATGGSGDDVIRAGDSGVKLTGGDGDDVIASRAGDDLIRGEGGADRIDAGAGDD